MPHHKRRIALVGSTLALSVSVAIWRGSFNRADVGNSELLNEATLERQGPSPIGVPSSEPELRRNWEDWLSKPAKGRKNDDYLADFRKFFLAHPEAALEALAKEPDYGIRRIVLLDLVKSAELDQVPAILTAADGLVSSDALKDVYAGGMRRLARDATETCIPVWNALAPSTAKSWALSTLVSEWPGQAALEPLLDLYRNLEFSDDQETFRWGFENKLRVVSEAGLQEVRRHVRDMPALELLAEQALGRVMSAAIPANDLLHREGQAAELTEAMWRAAIEKTTNEKPWEVAESIKTTTEMEALGPLAMHLVSLLTATDPGRTASWVEALPPGDTVDRLAYIMMIRWLGENPQAASTYALAAKNERTKQVVALAIATDLRQKGDLEGFERWRALINDPDLRTHAENNTIP